MRYPNSLKTFHKKVSHANRGMNLEGLINEANKHYLDNDIAIIYKKPTPIGVVNVSDENNNKIITKAYFKEPSTLDYVGLYKNRYIEFDAKETKSLTSFPLSNISPHQLSHMKRIINHGGITFLIININSNYYLLDATCIFSFIDKNKRKSIPIKYIVENSFTIESYKDIKLNYIEALNKLIGGTKWRS